MMTGRFPFTRAALRNLPLPSETWAYYYDDSTRGLAVGVGPSGTKSLLVYRKFKGRPVRIALGVFDPEIPDTRELPDGARPLDLLGERPSLNVRMARKLATAVNAKLDVGVNPAAEKRKQRQKASEELTLGDLFKQYRANLVSEGKKRVSGVVWYFERYLGALPDVPSKKHGKKRQKAEGSVNWERRPLSDFGILKWPTLAVCFGPPLDRANFYSGFERELGSGGWSWTGEPRWSCSNRFGWSMSLG